MVIKNLLEELLYNLQGNILQEYLILERHYQQ